MAAKPKKSFITESNDKFIRIACEGAGVLPIGEFRPFQGELKELTEAAFHQLRDKILKQGFSFPIAVWQHKGSNFIIAGHQRIRAIGKLIEEGYECPPLPVNYIHAESMKEAKEKLLGDVAQYGRVTSQGLYEYIEDAKLDYQEVIEDFRFPEIDFKHFEAEYYTDPIGGGNEGNTDPDSIPEVKESICKTGQLWQLGDHRLLCGDCTDKANVERLMGGEKADMVFTDPPYNVNYGESKNFRHKIWNLENDNLSDDEWHNFNQDIIINLKEYANGDLYVWGASGPDGMRQRLLFVDNGFHWSATIIWKKQQLVLSPAKYQRMYEPCFYGWLDKSSYRGNRKQTEVWEINRPLNSKEHPTMKPIELCSKAIKNSSIRNNIVLDLFGGSGSTLIACEQLNRKCYMMEIDPKYIDVIIERWENFTGERAVKL
jgi:DNA modification methylase